MSEFIPIQAGIFGATILCGIGMGVIYDTIRIFRRVVPHSNIMIALEDLTYWICCSILLFYVLYSKDNGIIRGFSILGVMSGLCVYYISISKAYVKATSWIINKVKGYMYSLIKLLVTPIRWIYRFLKKITIKPRKAVRKQLIKSYEQVKMNKEQSKLKKQTYKNNKKIKKNNDIKRKKTVNIKSEINKQQKNKQQKNKQQKNKG